MASSSSRLARERLRHLFELTGLDQVLRVVGSVDEVLGA
jgi:hypothetical protein